MQQREVPEEPWQFLHLHLKRTFIFQFHPQVEALSNSDEGQDDLGNERGKDWQGRADAPENVAVVKEIFCRQDVGRQDQCWKNKFENEEHLDENKVSPFWILRSPRFFMV